MASEVLDTYQTLISSFSDFLTVAIHAILYERNIYPKESFLNARKYNYPVRQNRHPQVCTWISDAVAAVEAELLKGTVSQTSLIIYSPTSIPLERFIFSTASFPIVHPSEAHTPFTYHGQTSAQTNAARPGSSSSGRSSPTPNPPQPFVPVTEHTPLIDLTTQFAAVISRLNTLGSTLAPLPPDCSFTLAIELRDRPDGEPPIGWPQPWMPARPGLQGPPNGESNDVTTGRRREVDTGRVRSADGGEGIGTRVTERGKYLGGVKTTPVRAVEAGPFIMEVWVEEGKDKAEAIAALEGGTE